ncbi:MAG: hypothetical protein GX442_11245 [Candidatus Riflebacteria bacterium]|nr:hypothetical protein [Candidatus Riflebacteria bacterium]
MNARNPAAIRGLTMVELMIAVLVGATVVFAGSKLLTSGLQSFRKSTSTLSLTQAVGILLENLAADIRRSRGFEADQGRLRLDTTGWDGSRVVDQRVEYAVSANGQGVDRSVAGGEAHPFCRGLRITNLSFSRPLGERGILVEVEVSVPPLYKESIRCKRFYFAEAHPVNAVATGFHR